MGDPISCEGFAVERGKLHVLSAERKWRETKGERERNVNQGAACLTADERR